MAEPTDDNPFAKYTAATATPNEGDNPFAKYAAEQPGLLKSFGHGFVEGGTFGFNDELGLTSKEANEASKQANPWTHFMGELAGSVVPMSAAALLPTGASQVAAGARATNLAQKGLGLVRTALVPGEINTLGQSVKQGVKLGANYGLLSGAGHADVKPEDSTAEALTKRGTDALIGGTMGAALGAPFGVVGHGVSKLAQHIGGARVAAKAETQDASAGALTSLSKTLDRDRISPQTLIDQIRSDFPTDTATAGGTGSRWWGTGTAAQRGVWTADMVEDLVARALNGETAQEISQALTVNGKGPKVGAVKTMLGELAERYSVPLNIVDRAKLSGKPGAGENTEWTLRAASATPGEARAIARERLVERQIGQGQRLSDTITRHIGDADFEAKAAKLTDDIVALNKTNYDDAHALDALNRTLGKPLDIQPTVDAYALKWINSRGPIATAMREVVDIFKPATVGTKESGQSLQPISTLEGFMQSKAELQALFDKYATNKSVLRELMKFKNDLYKSVAEQNPKWKIANDKAADGFAAERALNLGTEFAGRLNTKMREHLAQFKMMSEPEQKLYKIGLARALNDRLLNKQSTHDLTAELRLPGARQALETILGKEDAAKFFRTIEREAATTRTYRSQFGSQTTPLKEAQADLNWAPQFESAWQMLSPRKIAEQTAVWLARQMAEKRNTQLMDMLTTDDILRQLDILRRAQSVHAARSNARELFGKPVIASGAPLADAVMGHRAEAMAPRQPRKPLMEPYRP